MVIGHTEMDKGFDTPCWIYDGYKHPKSGYGYLQRSSSGGRPEPAHRWYYREYVGDIGEGMEIDHLCRVRSCVNPAHLEPVTKSENALRGDTGSWRRPDVCKRGHDLTDPGNLYKGRARRCRACDAMRREVLGA